MPNKLADTKKMTYEEWVALRKSSIGGSDAGTIMGVNPYSSLLTLYADKKSLSKEIEDNESMRLGRDLEAYVAERYMEETGRKVRNDFFMYTDDDLPYITANIDRRIVGENAGLECKTMNSRANYDLSKGDVPATYFAQCQHYMMVMNFDYMELAILKFGEPLHVFHIDRDYEYITELRKKEIAFWKMVETDFEPAPDGSDAATETIKELYPQAEKNTEIMIPEIDELIAEYRFLKGEEKEIKENIKALQNKITFQMGENESALGERYGCSWKNQSRSAVDTELLKAKYPEIYQECCKVSDSRVFRTRSL